MTETTTIPETKKTPPPAEEMRTAAARLETARTKATASPWRARPVWSPDAKSTSAVYSHAHPTGTVESEVVASGRIRSGYGGTRSPYNVIYFTLLQPATTAPLVQWLRDEAKRYDDEVIGDAPEGPCCAEPSVCGGHGEVEFHQECGGIVGAAEDDDPCICFNAALAFARGINTTWEEL